MFVVLSVLLASACGGDAQGPFGRELTAEYTFLLADGYVRPVRPGEMSGAPPNADWIVEATFGEGRFEYRWWPPARASSTNAVSGVVEYDDRVGTGTRWHLRPDDGPTQGIAFWHGVGGHVFVPALDPERGRLMPGQTWLADVVRR